MIDPSRSPSRRQALLGLAGVLALAGCGRRRLRRFDQAEEDAEELVNRVRSQSAPYAMLARFAIRVSGPDFFGSTTGSMVMLQPDKFRIELKTPVGAAPMFYLASDGRSLHAWAAKGSTFYRGDDAVAVLRELTGGTVTSGDLIRMMTGSLPLPEAPIVDLGDDPDGAIRVVFQPAKDLKVRAAVDRRSEILRRIQLLQVSPEGEEKLLVKVSYEDLMRVGQSKLPESIKLELPGIGYTAHIEIHTWDELGRIPDAWTLEAPSNSTEKDLVQELRRMAKEPEELLPEGS